jgi:rhomboid family GlyGly-CTERM serine protease
MPMHSFSLSAAERCALAVAVFALVLMAPDLAEPLEYRRALLVHEPWRLLTGHFVHLNWPHALINALALMIVARLFAPDLNARRQVSVLLASAVTISVGLAVIYPAIAWYRGLSGVVHALFFAGATTLLASTRAWNLRTLWLPTALLIGGWAKVLLEQPTGEVLPQAEWLGAAVVPQAHLVGAACGSLLGLTFALADRLHAKHRTQH